MTRVGSVSIISFSVAGLMLLGITVLLLYSSFYLKPGQQPVMTLAFGVLGTATVPLLVIGVFAGAMALSARNGSDAAGVKELEISDLHERMSESTLERWLDSCPHCGSLRLDMTRPEKAQCYACGRLTYRDGYEMY